MVFRYYSNFVSHASKSFAIGTFIIALLLIGFGVVILAFPEVFAFLAAFLFFVMGIGCVGTAIKIYMMHRRLGGMDSNDLNSYRKNVRIRNDEYFEM